MLHELQFSSETINAVRFAFKTNDLYYRKEVDSLKRKIMTAKRIGDQYKLMLDELTALATKIAGEMDNKVDTSVASATTSLVYIKGK
jgi:hypothetical protein